MRRQQRVPTLVLLLLFILGRKRIRRDAQESCGMRIRSQHSQSTKEDYHDQQENLRSFDPVLSGGCA